MYVCPYKVKDQLYIGHLAEYKLFDRHACIDSFSANIRSHSVCQ